MKKQNLFFTASLLALATSLQARAEVIDQFVSTLTSGTLAAEHSEMGSSFSGGKVILNDSKKTITLHVDRVIICPPGHACAAVMPEPIHVELPITEEITTRCGTRTIVASEDLRPVDGMLTEVRIVEKTLFSRCFAPNINPSVTVTYRTNHVSRLEGKEIDAISAFTGTSFSGKSWEAASLPMPKLEIPRQADASLRAALKLRRQ